MTIALALAGVVLALAGGFFALVCGMLVQELFDKKEEESGPAVIAFFIFSICIAASAACFYIAGTMAGAQ